MYLSNAVLRNMIERKTGSIVTLFQFYENQSCVGVVQDDTVIDVTDVLSIIKGGDEEIQRVEGTPSSTTWASS